MDIIHFPLKSQATQGLFLVIFEEDQYTSLVKATHMHLLHLDSYKIIDIPAISTLYLSKHWYTHGIGSGFLSLDSLSSHFRMKGHLGANELLEA